MYLRGPFEKFSESEICGGGVTDSFSKYLPSYNAPPTSRKRPVSRLPQASGGQWNRWFSCLGTWLEKPGNRMGRDLDSIGLMDELQGF
jgi:hypothetical protein